MTTCAGPAREHRGSGPSGNQPHGPQAEPAGCYTQERRPSGTRPRDVQRMAEMHDAKSSNSSTLPTNLHLFQNMLRAKENTSVGCAPIYLPCPMHKEGPERTAGPQAGTQGIKSQQDLYTYRPCVLKTLFYSLEAEQTFLQLLQFISWALQHEFLPTKLG